MTLLGSLPSGNAGLRRALGVSVERDGSGVILRLPGGYRLACPPPPEADIDLSWVLRIAQVWGDVTMLDEYDTRSHLRSGMTVVDVGANIGSFSLLAHQIVGPEGRILAIEPEPSNHSCLLRNIEQNGLSSVTALRLALGEAPGSLSLALSEHGIGGHSAVMERSDRTVEVPLTTLDDVCAREDLQRLDFLKIDVEGYEPQVLEGGRETIARFRPTIAAAAYHFPEHAKLLPQIVRSIDDGYRTSVRAVGPGLEAKCFAVHESGPR